MTAHWYVSGGSIPGSSYSSGTVLSRARNHSRASVMSNSPDPISGGLSKTIGGVSFDSPEELRHSLLAFAESYTTTQDRVRQRELRARVIDAKDQLRLLISETSEPVLRAERES